MSVNATPTTAQRATAEVLGTFVLVFFGCGAAVMSGLTVGQQTGYIVTGLTFGLTVVVMAYAVGRISGGHFNPAVTIGAIVAKRLPARDAGLYIGSQLVGGLLAGLALLVLLQGFDGWSVDEVGLGANGFGDDASGYAWWAAFLLEALLTAVFLWVILSVTDERHEHPGLAPLAIGLALAMIHFASMTATGTSVNPARSIGVGLFSGSEAIKDLWLFILAPSLGAAIAGFTYPLMFGTSSSPEAPRDDFQTEWNEPETPAS